MGRWILEIRDFNYKIEYKPGKKNLVADQLSRPVRPIRPAPVENDSDISFLGKTKDEFRELQDAEPRWREMKTYLEGGRIPRLKYPRSTLNQFILEDGILYSTKQKLDNSLLYVLVVPSELRKRAMVLAHEKESGHLGQLKSILKAEDLFYWPNLRVDMRKFVKECGLCQQTKSSSGLQTQWQELPPCNQPLERVSMDITEMVTNNSGYRYVLTLICHYSRYVKFLKLRSRMAEEVGRNLELYMGDFGAPKVLMTDNALEFHSAQIKELCKNNGTKIVYTTPYHPQGNSVSERMHRTMKSVLSNLCRGQEHKWPNHLLKCQKVLNTAVHETTGEQPYYLMFSRHAPRGVSVPLPQIDDETDIEVAHEVIRETNRERANRWRERANQGRKNQTLEVNDLVWVKRESVSSHVEKKLGIKWIGPYKIIEVIRNGGAYTLENTFDGTRIQRAAEKIKKYIGQDRILIEQEEVLLPHAEDLEEEEEEEERIPRQRRPPRRYVEEC